MRTTLQVDDDVLAVARVMAGERGISVGAALSELARRGLHPRGAAEDHGLPVFDVADDAPLITPEMVREAAEEP